MPKLHPHLTQKLLCIFRQRSAGAKYQYAGEHGLHTDRLDHQTPFDKIQCDDRMRYAFA